MQTAVSPVLLAVVVTFDHWPLASLGCYGNEWVDTPTWDALATTGFVFDRQVANHVASRDDAPAAISAGWLTAVLEQGTRVVVMCEPDARGLPDLPANIELVTVAEGHEPPATPQDLPFARLIQAAQAFLQAPTTTPTVLWLHSAGITTDSVPPEDMWDHYVDEFAAEDFDWEHGDPAEIARHPAIRAVYVTMVDFLLGELWTSLRQRPERVLFSCSALAGDPWLPVERRVPVPAGLDAPSLHAPWVLWEQPASDTPSDNKAVIGRSSVLVQPSDLGATIAAWCRDPATCSTGAQGLWPILHGGQLDETRPLVVTRSDGPELCVWTEHDQTIFPDGLTLNKDDFAGIQRFWQPEDPWNVFDTAATSHERIQEVVTLATCPG